MQFPCTYCSGPALNKISGGKNYRYREIDGIMKEISWIHKEYPNLRFIYFDAENVLSDVKRFSDLCHALIAYNKHRPDKLDFSLKLSFTNNLLDKDLYIIKMIKEAKINWIQFGLESDSLEIRKKFKRLYHTNEQMIDFCRILREHNIKTLMYIIYSYPFETKQTYKETIECLKKCKPDRISLSWLTPLGKTELERQLKDFKYPKTDIIDKYRYLTLKFRVYRTYKTFKEMLYLLTEEIRIFSPVINILNRIDRYYDNKNEKYKSLAKNAFDAQNFKEALKYFNKIKIKSSDGWIYGDRAIVKMNTGDYKGALTDFDKSLQMEEVEIYHKKRQECLLKFKEGR